MIFAAWAFAVVGCVVTGAYLAVNGHEYLGFFAILLAGCFSTKSGTGDGSK